MGQCNGYASVISHLRVCRGWSLILDVDLAIFVARLDNFETATAYPAHNGSFRAVLYACLAVFAQAPALFDPATMSDPEWVSFAWIWIFAELTVLAEKSRAEPVAVFKPVGLTFYLYGKWADSPAIQAKAAAAHEVVTEIAHNAPPMRSKVSHRAAQLPERPRIVVSHSEVARC